MHPLYSICRQSILFQTSCVASLYVNASVLDLASHIDYCCGGEGGRQITQTLYVLFQRLFNITLRLSDGWSPQGLIPMSLCQLGNHHSLYRLSRCVPKITSLLLKSSLQKTPKHVPARSCHITAREELSNHAVVLTTYLRHRQHCEGPVLTRKSPLVRKCWTHLKRHQRGHNNLCPNLYYRSGPTQKNTRRKH